MTALKIQITKKDAFYLALLAISCLFVFREIIFQGQILFGADFFTLHLGMKQFLYDEIHLHHTIPYWNPYVFAGLPFSAHLESTIFYPLDILFWLMPPERAYGYTVFFHAYLAGAFMYLFSRSLGIRPAGAILSALCFLFSGLMLATIYDGQMFRVQAFSWIPLILLFVHRALSFSKPLPNTATAGFFWGIQILSGAPQDALYTLIAVFLFSLFMGNWNSAHLSSALKPAKTLGIFFLVGLGVAAVQIVPSYEFVRESVRGAMKQYPLMTMGSYPPEGIITWILPHFYGRFAADNYWVAGVPWSVPLYNLYVGILPLFLLLFVPYRESGNRRIIAFAITLALLSFLMALGSNTPLFRFIVILPGFDKIRAPAKIIILWVLAMSLLAGKGMDGLLNSSKASLNRPLIVSFGIILAVLVLDVAFYTDRSLALKLFRPFFLDQAIPGKLTFAASTIAGEWQRFTLVSGISFLIMILWARGLLKRPHVATLLCGLLFLDLAYVNRGAVRHDDRVYTEAAHVKQELAEALNQDGNVFRVGSFKSGWGANFEMYLGYQNIGGYNPLLLHRYYKCLNQYQFYGRPIPEGWIIFFYERHKNHILMDLLNVKYEISHETKTLGLRETYLPRAFLVPQFKLMPEEKILDALIKPGFDPTQVVLFEKGIQDVPLLPQTNNAPVDLGKARIESYRPDSIVLSVDATSTAFLFLSEVYYPGWKAFIDGHATRILRGNYLFRVLEVPKGRHEVYLEFDPWTIKAGTAITLLTLLLLLAGPVSRKFKRKAYIS
jgi:hypothetical protein